MSETLAAHVERVVRLRVIGWRPVIGRGWSVAHRGVYTLESGETVFAKMGAEADTEAAIRTECAVYPLISGPFVPRLVASDPAVPVLVIEDLSAAEWPPPWTASCLESLDALFVELAATVADSQLPTLTERLRAWGAWERVAADSEPLLTSRVVSAGWLEHHLPALLDAQNGASAEGDSLVHLDIRSDNLCFRHGRALLVDWNHAVRGNPRWDRLLMLHTVEMEGGPPAAAQAPGADPGIVTWAAGYFAARIGRPAPQGAPLVRAFQRAQLDVVLPWACRLLGIEPPTG
jgi:hypothetical protein